MGVKSDIVFVSHQDDGVPFVVQPLEQGHNFNTGCGIEIAGWFIGQQNRGVIHQRAGNRNALALTA